tara:strand:+ start:240 stop:494 length:255 start_codon:yes stop_codon:yes gene_type:complete
MPQHKSAKKRVLQSLKRKVNNTVIMTKYRKAVKKIEGFKSKIDDDTKKTLLKEINSLAFKAVKKGLIKKRNASRKISRLAKILK